MEIFIGVIVIILVVIIIAAKSSSGVEKIEKLETEERNKNEMTFNQVINQEPNEKARGFLRKSKEMFDNGEAADFLDVDVKVGVPEEIAYSKNVNLINGYVGFEDEQAKHLFTTYCFGLSKRYELQNQKLRTIDDAFEKHKVVLNKGEVLFETFNNIYCLQEKTVQKNITYTGIRYSNGLLRAGNLSYSTNDIKTFVIEDYGKVLLTNKRIIFAGKQKNFSLNVTISNILDYYLYRDGILLCRSNRKNVMFKEAQFKNYGQPNDDYCFILNDFPIQFISIIGRIANQTEDRKIG